MQRITDLLATAGPSTADFLRTPSTARTALGAILGLWAIRRVNAFVSRRALNNGVLNHPWIWDGSLPNSELVLVTGGSSGIGLSIVRGLLAKGVRVAVMDLNEPTAEVLSEWKAKAKESGHVRFYRCDVTDSAQVREAAGKIRAEMGDPTVLVNNAGVGTARDILTESEAETRKTFEVNILSHFVMIREFLPAMIKRNHGHVVSIASMASFVTIAGNVDYSCTKAGVMALDEGLRQELKHRYNAPNVRTSVVHPNWVRTPLIEALFSIPERPWNDSVLEVDEVGNAVVDQILKGESGQVCLPRKLAGAPSIRAYPFWVQERLRGSRAGLLADLEKFRGQTTLMDGKPSMRMGQ